MAHFAVLCRSDAGHVYPHTLIGRALRERGHRITLINRLPELEARANELDLEWHLISEDAPPPPSKLEKTLATLRWVAGGLLLRRFTAGKAGLVYPRLLQPSILLPKCAFRTRSTDRGVGGGVAQGRWWRELAPISYECSGICRNSEVSEILQLPQQSSKNVVDTLRCRVANGL